MLGSSYGRLHSQSTVGVLESYAILDQLDQMVGPEKSLCPPAGRDRKRVMKLTAIGLACMEKAQWAFYERRFHPEEKVHQPWIDHNDAQVIAGMKYLDGLAAQAADGWLAKTPRISQADIPGTVAFTFARTVRPHLNLGKEMPHLARMADQCEDLPAFKAASLPALPT